MSGIRVPAEVCTTCKRCPSWVKVPVLSNTTVSISASPCKDCNSRTSTPPRANRPALASIAAGVASDRAHGQVTIKTETATIKAREPLTTLKISKDMFYRLVAEVPQMAIEVMRELAHRLEDTNKKLREATAKKAA